MSDIQEQMNDTMEVSHFNNDWGGMILTRCLEYVEKMTVEEYGDLYDEVCASMPDSCPKCQGVNITKNWYRDERNNKWGHDCHDCENVFETDVKL